MRVYTSGEESPSKEVIQDEEVARFSVLFAKASTRKHKKWEGDGILICYSKFAVLKNEAETTIISKGTGIKRLEELVEGFTFKMGSLEVQIQEQLQSGLSCSSLQLPAEGARDQKVYNPTPSSDKLPLTVSNSSSIERRGLKRAAEQTNSALPNKFVSKGFVCPLRGHASDNGADSIIPTSNGNEDSLIIAPIFGRHLRQHQKDGVSYIYDRLNKPSGGVILADEMGLGKSVQTLASMYALMGNKVCSTGSVRKCLLVVPSSLVNNWKAEFKKWFSTFRIPVVDVKKASDVSCFTSAYRYSPFLLISYDMAIRLQELLKKIQFDVLVCDEGHRLKNINGKLNDLNVPRRLLLTGTPVQNDLDELYSLLDFARPGVFGTPPEFRKKCSDENNEDLSKLMDDTVLRRTGEVNKSHLPEKHEYVIFCRQSPIQATVFAKLCDHMTGEHLVLIDFMRKLANHPAVLYKKLVEKCEADPSYASLLASFPNDFGEKQPTIKDSGKLSVLCEMLAKFCLLGECTVVVSNYTKTLDMISGLCSSIGLKVLRLDGGTAVNERQKLVNKFNNERNPHNVFLLSTKAGGVGLNLIAASRLILFDSDWNPASDLQAMGRIWRDGQTRPCHIFRLCTAGSIDEKIFQRQVKKTALSSVLGVNYENSGNVQFRDEDLMDIFSTCSSDCNTHDLLECTCGGNGILPTEVDDDDSSEFEAESISTENIPSDIIENIDVPVENIPAEDNPEEIEQSEPASMAELFRWRHFSPMYPSSWELFLTNSGLKASSYLTFAFHLTSQF